MRRVSLLLPAIALCVSCWAAPANASVPSYDKDGARFIHQWVWTLTDAMVDEIRTPCTISRVYAYCNIAAYEAARPGYPDFRSFAGQLNGLTPPPKAPKTQIDWRVAAIAAYHRVAGKLLYFYDRSEARYEGDLDNLKQMGVSKQVIAASVKYGEKVGDHIIAWSGKDGFREVQAMGDYEFPKGEEHWQPTPPDFLRPVDPYWNRVRPFVLTGPRQIPPDPPIPFSKDPSSAFYKDEKEVWEIGKNLTEEQIMVAKFWDCNPIHSFHFGHMAFKTRQISPAGHWMNIAKIVCVKQQRGMMEVLETYALTSVAIADGFLSCWTEKYRDNTIRPITYINRYMDSTWTPLIQTPPFPDHSSGHSTISAAAAVVLTKQLGAVPFDDDTEEYLNMPVRTFPNFMAAAYEAAMSRLYGGIHIRSSNTAGPKNGTEIAEYLLGKIKTRVK